MAHPNVLDRQCRRAFDVLPSPLSDRALLLRPVDIAVVENTDRGSLHVVILPAPQRPKESCEHGEAGDPGARASPRRRTRNALTVTRIEEPDTATSAINGVTRPAIAIGTAMAL